MKMREVQEVARAEAAMLRCIAEATPQRIDADMSERESWNVVRERPMDSPAAKAGYEQTRSAYEIGRTVRELREARGLSQRELAERIGATQSVVGRLEAGGSRPTIVKLDRVAGALGVRLEVRFHDLQGSPKPKLRPTRKVARAISGP